MESTLDAALGKKIRQARDEAGLTQQELGDQIGLGQDAISLYERGERTIHLHILLDLARELERPLNYFLDCGSGTLVVAEGSKLHEIFLGVQSSHEEVDSLYEHFKYLLFRRKHPRA